MRRVTLLAMLAACASPPVAAPTPRPPAIAAQAGPKLRVGRPAERIGGPPTWASSTELDALRLCRDDRELLVIDDGWLRRYRTADGALVAETEIGKQDPNVLANRRPTLDCRGSDGAALVVAGTGTPEIVDAAGRATAPPRPVTAIGAMFTPDGTVRAVDDDGVITEWRGSDVSAAGGAAEPMAMGIGEGGTVFAYTRTAPGKDVYGWTIAQGSAHARLPGGDGYSEAKSIAMAPDGTVAIEGELGAMAWLANRRGYGIGKVLFNGGGARLGGIAASDHGFAVLQGDIYYRARYAFKWRDVGAPCDSFADGIALDRGDRHAYVGCPTGVHVVELATGKVVSSDGDTAAGGELAWSPDGARIAVRGASGRITVWRGATLDKRLIGERSSGGLWWTSASELGGEDQGELVAWPLATGTEQPATPELEGHLFARTRDGTIVVVQRHMQGPEWTLRAGDRSLPIEAGWVGELAVDPAGKRAAIAIGQYNQTPWQSVVAFDLATGSATPYPIQATAIAIGSDVLVVAHGDSAVVTQLAGGRTATVSHGAAISSLAIARGVIAVGGADGVVSLWTTDGTAIGTLAGARGELAALAFSPDGSRLAATGVAGTWSWNLAP